MWCISTCISIIQQGFRKNPVRMLPTSVSSLEEAQRQEREQQRPKRELRDIDVIMYIR